MGKGLGLVIVVGEGLIHNGAVGEDLGHVGVLEQSLALVTC